jgi:hypothetical protein
MIQYFDFNNHADRPSIFLCNPNKSPIHSLGLCVDPKLTLRYNGLSEFKFSIPEKVLNSNNEYVTIPAYGFIEPKRIVHIDNVGYFIITDVEEDMGNQEVDIKNVTCKSKEYEMSYKKFNAFTGTYFLYDPLQPNKSLMTIVLSKLKGWTLGTIDSSFNAKARTFDVTDNNVYNFLMNDVSTAFDCIFMFDTINQVIAIRDKNNATFDTNVFMSFDNLIKNVSLNTFSDELITALNVYGAGDLDIRTVNPLGLATIYNFDYYKNLNWMSQGLIDAIDTWESLIEIYRPIYASVLTSLKDFYANILILEIQLAEKIAEYDAQVGVQKARIEGGLPIVDINAIINIKSSEITALKNAITAEEANVVLYKGQLISISDDILGFEVNFTSDQLTELHPFIIESSYINENFIVTDLMSNADIQTEAETLYQQGLVILERLSQPRYEFSMDSVNFVFLKEYLHFTNQLQLGSLVTIDVEKSNSIQTVLLEVEINYDKPDDFKLTFSNRLRLDNAGYIFTDLFSESIKAGVDNVVHGADWGDWNNNYKDNVSTFINSALDASVNALMSSTNQEIVINENGLRGKKFISEDNYGLEQIWLTNNLIAFTDDAWNTAKAALGKITAPDGSTVYGLVAGAIFGNIIATNKLVIKNEALNFEVDALGATLSNATFTITNGSNQILLNPDDGIKIQKSLGGGIWEDQFFVDIDGNINFAGKLTGDAVNFNTGTIAGFSITPEGIFAPPPNETNYYLKSNGDFKWGGLTISGSTATFDGVIYAHNINVDGGGIVNNQIDNVSTGKLSNGVMNSGTAIAWPGVHFGVTGTGVSELRVDSNLFIGISGTNKGIEIRNNEGIILTHGSGFITLGLVGDVAAFSGDVVARIGGDNWLGDTQDVIISGTTLRFKKGLFVGTA